MKSIFILSLFIFTVLSADPNCETSISDNHCIKCKSGYFLTIDDTTESGIPNLKCQAVNAISNCELYDGNACVKCKSGYYLSDNTCQQCTITNCNYCAKVDGNVICIECKNSLSISINEKECVDCTTTANNEKCGRCGSGKYLDVSSKSCKSCMTGCSMCTESYNCFQCTGGRILTRKAASNAEATSSKPDSCVAIQNCASGYLKDDHCELCVDGYTLKYGNCVKCPTSCNTCYFTDYNLESPDKCTTCVSGYMPKNGQCVTPGSYYCDKYSTTYGCLKCKDGYFFDENYNCQQCDKSCATCVNSKTHCTKCAANYYFSGTGENTVCKSMAEACEL